jgi:hypothetical protein
MRATECRFTTDSPAPLNRRRRRPTWRRRAILCRRRTGPSLEPDRCATLVLHRAWFACSFVRSAGRSRFLSFASPQFDSIRFRLFGARRRRSALSGRRPPARLASRDVFSVGRSVGRAPKVSSATLIERGSQQQCGTTISRRCISVSPRAGSVRGLGAGRDGGGCASAIRLLFDVVELLLLLVERSAAGLHAFRPAASFKRGRIALELDNERLRTVRDGESALT